MNRTELYGIIGRYLESPTESEELAAQLATVPADYAEILAGYRAQLPKRWDVPSPSKQQQSFELPHLKARHPEAQLFFNVPSSYSLFQPYKLLIFMHGGGAGVPLNSGFHYLTDHPTVGMSPVIDATPCITVAPSAPFPERSNDRWAEGGAEDYIADVIEECMYRFNINPNTVYLAGMSMGGSGAYALPSRIGDRFGAVLAASGSWSKINFSCLAGTPFGILHGRNDAVACKRPRFTDIFCAHTAHLLLAAENLEHLYLPHDHGHCIAANVLGHELLKRALDYTISHVRDPFYPRVVAMTPCGTTQFHESPDIDSPHHRWITIRQIGAGTVEVSGKKLTGPYPSRQETAEDFAAQSFTLTRARVSAGLLDAVCKGQNVFECSAQNVKKFSIWLHPAMVDFAQPVRVFVNGQLQQFNKLAPSLLTALRSYRRRRYFGLIYPCEIKVPVADASVTGNRCSA